MQKKIFLPIGTDSFEITSLNYDVSFIPILQISTQILIRLQYVSNIQIFLK